MVNPLAAYVESIGGKSPRVELLRRCRASGWKKCSQAILWLWCNDRRWPTLESQRRLEAVTGGAVTPADWTAYGIARLDAGTPRPAPYGRRRKARAAVVVRSPKKAAS